MLHLKKRERNVKSLLDDLIFTYPLVINLAKVHVLDILIQVKLNNF